MTARLKAAGVMGVVFLWFAAFPVALATPNDSVIGWVAFCFFLAPVVILLVVCVGWLVVQIYGELVERFEGDSR